MKKNSDNTEPATKSNGSPRVIKLLSGISIVTGSMLGVGIFIFPQIIAQYSGSVLLFFVLWVLGGLYSISGAVSCGELGAMIPQAGGEYVYQRIALGKSVAFASGWVLFVAIFGGSIAGMSVAIFEYQIPALLGIETSINFSEYLPIRLSHILALLLIFVLTLLNHFGTRVSAFFQVIVTLLPIVLILIVSFISIDVKNGISGSFINDNQITEFSFNGFVIGFLFVNFAYSGWINIIYVAGEVKNPGKNIPRSMFISTFFITILYCLICGVYINVLGFSELASMVNIDAGTGMALALKNEMIGILVLLSITMAIVTSVNATVLTSSRVAFAMSCEGDFWKGASKLSGKCQTPRNALWVQALLSSVLVISGSFSAIIEMTSIAMLITGALTVISMFVLRIKHPGLPRPYKAFGYPWFPALYIALSVLVLAGVVLQIIKREGLSAYYPLIGCGVLTITFLCHKYISYLKMNKP